MMKIFLYARCWGQHGGHMSMVETGPSGVTWGLGFDCMPYYYNKGFGGAVSTGQCPLSRSCLVSYSFSDCLSI